ncbi:MAG: helix-turn-helix domain-containing protein [Pigmentiphaga sp.]|nr:helix-turn-helix domain-containing protein [Pigmentiphaga sp.]
MDASHDRDHLAGLAKGLRILEVFDSRHTRVTVAEAARQVGLSRASARRCLLTLAALGYVETDGKRYWLGHGALRLAYAYVSSTRLPRLIQPVLDALCERNRDSASLAVLFDAAAVIAARATARRTMRIGLVVGSRLPLHCSAAGRVLLAGLPEAQAAALLLKQELRPFTANTVTELSSLATLLVECRANGYALCNEEIELGVRSIGVPLFDAAGTVLAALTISTRAERMTSGEMVQTYFPMLKAQQEWVRTRLLA